MDSLARRCGPMILAMVLACAGRAQAQAPKLLDVRKIWDEAPHNAFTDLVWHDDAFYCVFREGAGHVSPDGAIRVLSSRDGLEWRPIARLTMAEADLRDPKISVGPGNRLMLLAAAAFGPESKIRHQTYMWESRDGHEWGEPKAVGDPNVWLWRATWLDEEAYGIGYGTVEQRFLRLYRRPLGRLFTTHLPSVVIPGAGNESAIVFLPNRDAVCLMRRDGPKEQAAGMVGRARPPYKEWGWMPLGQQIGGPALLRLPDGRLVAGVRLYEPSARTALCWLDPSAGTLTEFLALPSGGDTSYAGLVWRDGTLFVSYYSSHEGKTAIYLARVAFTE